MADMEKEMPNAEVNEEVVAQATAEEVTASAPKKVKKEKANKKPNFFVRVAKRIAKFFRDFMSERKKIVWMSWKNVCKSAAVVVVLVCVLALIQLGVDTAFSKLFQLLSTIFN